MLTVLHEKMIDTGSSILGFADYQTFEIFVEEENPNFAYMQSVDDENIGFFVVDPFYLFPDYSFQLDDILVNKLGILSEEEVGVLGIITLKETLELSTVNLLAPIVINVRTLQACQYVLPPNNDFSTRVPLNAAKAKEGA